MGRRRIANTHWTSGALAVILLFLIFFIPSYGWHLRMLLSPVPAASPAAQAGEQNLAAANDALKAQLAVLQTVAVQMPTSSPSAVRAMVYSRYPMNFRNEFLVSAGSNEGVAVGDAAVFQGMLVGQVRTVYPEQAVVQTIFDNSLRMPVRIGMHGADGLLVGGSYPLVGSIAASAPVGAGDIVYSAVSGMPYALPVATVVSTGTSPDSLFEQASIGLPYDVNGVQTVSIITR